MRNNSSPLEQLLDGLESNNCWITILKLGFVFVLVMYELCKLIYNFFLLHWNFLTNSVNGKGTEGGILP